MLELTGKIISQIEADAERAYPDECCGFIYGRLMKSGKTAISAAPALNESEEEQRFHRFTITPEAMLAAERYAAKKGLDIIGFYHSHPDCQAVPSEYDRSHALPLYSYVIVSVLQGRAADFRSWELDPAADYTMFIGETIDHIKGE